MDRNSPIAGSWYEGSKEKLASQVSQLFIDSEFGPGEDPTITQSQDRVNPNLIGIISPHAGYVYSGRIAAWGYKVLYEAFPKIDTIIVLGPNHRGIGPPISVYPQGKWKFPLGDLQVDEEITNFIALWKENQNNSNIELEAEAHKYEHSIDIQYPILQYLYNNNIKIVSICVSDQSIENAEILSDLLKDILTHFDNRTVKIVASSDLSHEFDYSILMSNDEKMIELIKLGDADKANEFRRKNRMSMCGYGPVFTLMKLANKLGKQKIELLKYSNSKLIAPHSGSGYTVGYVSFTVEVD